MSDSISQGINVPELMQQALVHHQAGRLQEAQSLYREVLQAWPKHPDANHNLGVLELQLDQSAAALAHLKAALDANSSVGQYWLSYIAALSQAGQLDAARQVLAQGRERGLAGRQVEELATRLGDQADGIQPGTHVQRVDVAPTPAEISQMMALLGQERYAELEPMARELTLRFPQHGIGWQMLAASLRRLGRPEEALTSMQRAAALLPEEYTAQYALGNTFQEQGRLLEAEASYRRALELKPDFAVAHMNLGVALLGQGRFSEAEASLRLALRAQPDEAEVHFNLGIVLKELGRSSEAQVSYRRALELRPDFAEAYNNLGGLLKAEGELDQAMVCCERLLALKPDSAEAYNNLGSVFWERGRLSDAEASYRRALEIQPEYAEVHCNLGGVLQQRGQPEEAEASLRRALQIRPDLVAAQSNLLFVLNYLSDKSGEEISSAYREYDARFGVPLRASWPEHGNSRELGRRLKVGYVSPDFRRHPVSSFLEPLLARHDKAVVEVYAYAEVKREDAVSARCKGYVDHWVRTVGLSDEALAERIRGDGIDILVDLAGHTTGNRLQVFARKPAPVQVTWLGYPGSSGLSAMDYRLTDGCADPEGSEAYYSERLLRLPDCLCCYRPGEDMPEVTALPAQRNGYVAFGSFNNFNKINSRCIELWARLLRAVPEARLLMVTIPEGEPRQWLAEQFAALGISAERLEFQGRLSGGEFYRMMQRADIALDPFPVTGGTTTCETLWLGVPVIVLVGQRYISRVGYSFLSAAGFPEFAAATEQGYIDIATRLARDLARLAEIRAGMRAQVAASALMDEAGFARKVEAAYREMFGRWASKQ